MEGGGTRSAMGEPTASCALLDGSVCVAADIACERLAAIILYTQDFLIRARAATTGRDARKKALKETTKTRTRTASMTRSYGCTKGLILRLHQWKGSRRPRGKDPQQKERLEGCVEGDNVRERRIEERFEALVQRPYHTETQCLLQEQAPMPASRAVRDSWRDPIGAAGHEQCAFPQVCKDVPPPIAPFITGATGVGQSLEDVEEVQCGSVASRGGPGRARLSVRASLPLPAFVAHLHRDFEHRIEKRHPARTTPSNEVMMAGGRGARAVLRMYELPTCTHTRVSPSFLA